MHDALTRHLQLATPARALAVLILCSGAGVMSETGRARADEIREPRPIHFFAQLKGTRPGWPEEMTADEERIMGEHFVYLKELVAKKKVIAAGPVFNPVFGLVILQVASETEARDIMDREPSVLAGVHTYELSPMVLSLLASHVAQDRYVNAPDERVLVKEISIPAPIDSVWSIWTTSAGVRAFLGAEANIELRPGGPFEIYFNMEAPVGQRGSEDCRVLSFQPKRMLSFEWNAPPQFGALRLKRTQVVIRFEPLGETAVGITLAHLGWGTGSEWDKLYDYFDQAWSRVLQACRSHFTADGDD